MKKFRHYIYQSSADFTRAMLWEAKYIYSVIGRYSFHL